MRIERTVIALGLSALLYAQAPGVFDTLEADGDARFNGDVVFTTPSGALVSFQSLVNAGVGLPMTIDSDTSTQGYQCPSGMEEITAARGRVPIAVTPSGTLAGTNGDAYTDTDIARRGGTAQTLSISGTVTGSASLNGSPSYSPPTISYSPPTISNNLGVSVGSHHHSTDELYQATSANAPTGSGQTLVASNLNTVSTITGSTTPSASITGSVSASGGGVNVSGGSVGRGTLSVSDTFGFNGQNVSISNLPHPAPGFQMLWCQFS